MVETDPPEAVDWPLTREDLVLANEYVLVIGEDRIPALIRELADDYVVFQTIDSELGGTIRVENERIGSTVFDSPKDGPRPEDNTHPPRPAGGRAGEPAEPEANPPPVNDPPPPPVETTTVNVGSEIIERNGENQRRGRIVAITPAVVTIYFEGSGILELHPNEVAQRFRAVQE